MSVYTRQLRQLWITRFDFLGGCLGNGVEPSDIDQVLERCGNFLFIECKRPFQQTPRGQQILFNHLVGMSTERHDVRLLLVIGNPPDEIQKYGWWGRALRPGSAEDVRALVRRWWEWAGDR